MWAEQHCAGYSIELESDDYANAAWPWNELHIDTYLSTSDLLKLPDPGSDEPRVVRCESLRIGGHEYQDDDTGLTEVGTHTHEHTHTYTHTHTHTHQCDTTDAQNVRVTERQSATASSRAPVCQADRQAGRQSGRPIRCVASTCGLSVLLALRLPLHAETMCVCVCVCVCACL